MSSFFGELCKALAMELGKKAIERGTEALTQTTQENTPKRYPEKVIEPIPIHEAAGELADKLNLSCKSYRAVSMSREEAINEGFFWNPLDDPETARIQGYRGHSSILYIPYMIEGLRITEIGFGTFEDNSVLKKLYIPDTVEKIGDCAFCGCDNLDFVRIPNRKIEYPHDCFCRCPKLIKQEIREAIAEKSRRNLEHTMTEYEIDTKTPYEGGVMERAPYDEAVYYVANGLVNLGCFDYRGNGTEEIVRIPQKIGDITVTEIDSYAFNNNLYVRRIYIPDTVRIIRSKAIRSCPNLEYVRIPNNPELVFEENVFEECPKLLKQHLRETVDEKNQHNRKLVMSKYLLDDRTPYEGGEIGNGLFDESFYYVSRGGVNLGSFSYRGNEETVYIPPKIGDITVTKIDTFAFRDNLYVRRIFIPDTVRIIRKNAFCSCPNLEYVRIPNTPDLVFEENSFVNCPMLMKSEPSNAVIEENQCDSKLDVAEYEYNTQTSYESEKTESAPYDKAIYHATNGILNLVSFDPKEGAEETVRIPQKIGNTTVTEIASFAFSNNPYVRQIYLPDTVRIIRKKAFYNCPNLEYVHIPNNSELVFDKNAFVNCPKLELTNNTD